MQIINWNSLSISEKKCILSRPIVTDTTDLKNQVNNIIDTVKRHGNEALIKLTRDYDNVILEDLVVTCDEFKEAHRNVSTQAKHAIEFAKNQIEINHQSQLPKNKLIKTHEGVYCERQSRPIEKVGLYVPGGSAPLVSTVLMLGIPAKIAGCRIRILCTPPMENGKIDPNILFAAELCGIQHIYKVGGAQAIAAMAYGTETIPKVDKIYGPGNKWVTQAKMQIWEDPLAGTIDMPAGPSELMIIADKSGDANYIAADLLSQAEHGIDSQVMLVTLSKQLALRVYKKITEQLKKLPRKNIINMSLAQSRIIIVNDIHQAIELSNLYAPEHLILQVSKPDKYISNIHNAGAVFLGKWTPETVGDYVTGSNHVLPTYGYARNYNGLSVIDFIKFINFQKVTKAGLKKIGPYAEIFAELEGLLAHKQAISVRLCEKVKSA